MEKLNSPFKRVRQDFSNIQNLYRSQIARSQHDSYMKEMKKFRDLYDFDMVKSMYPIQFSVKNENVKEEDDHRTTLSNLYGNSIPPFKRYTYKDVDESIKKIIMK